MSIGHEYTIVVDGDSVTIRHDEFKITDVGSEMDDIGTKLSFVAALWASAEEEREMVDAQYRAWRAKAGERLLAKDVSSEWKVKQAIEADPKFLEYKKAIARTIRNTTFLKAQFQALDAKSRMLQSKSATMRAEYGATGGATGRGHREDESESKTRRSETAERVKKKLKKNKNKDKDKGTGHGEQA